MEPNQFQGNSNIEEQIPQAPMPSAEKTAEPSQGNQQEAQPEGHSEDDLTLPENASERTREQFEKLKARLREAEAKAEAKTQEPEPQFDSVLDEFRLPQSQQTYQQVETPNLNQTQVADIRQRFIDAEGNVDINGLNNALLQAEERAKRAEQIAYESSRRVEKIEETNQVREAHAAHPEVDPRSPKFDKKLYGLVRDRMLRNMYQGNKMSFAETVASVKADRGVQVKPDEVAQRAVSEYREKQERRNQGPFEPGKGVGRETLSDFDELRSRTQKGDAKAISERLKGIGI